MAPGRPRSLRALAFGSSRRDSSPSAVRSPSPTFSDATHASAMNFGANGPEKVITRSDLKTSLDAYEILMEQSARYRGALVEMSRATAAFADALEACSGLKGPTYETGTRLLAASGLHHLMGNHWHVLAETIDKTFEKPLRQHLDTYKTIMNERSAQYERALREKSRVIRATEARNMNRKERNLQSFREALTVLQRQVDELDDLKVSHYQEIMEHEEEVWNVVQGKTCVVVRSTMDVLDRFTSKASDPVIEVMLQTVPDPFDAYGPPQAKDQIFSILPPLSIMGGPTSSASTPTAQTPELHANGLPTNPSWVPASVTHDEIYRSDTAEWAESLPTAFTPPRSVSPPARGTSASPPASTSPTNNSRRNSIPPRKAESKLRSVLSVIDEGNARSAPPEMLTHSQSSPNLNGSGAMYEAPDPMNPSWSFTDAHQRMSSAEESEDAMTPRHSSFFPPDTDVVPDDTSQQKLALATT
ncbi:hypothetical protein BD626DRAFT_481470 [Schizophyllum amplum]|uniref:IMD domain-containing protein n=1 Tax=Schizophyllum amplum TaxID=97359 RepID=A0A550CU92_9AGAR|nr:hypothetical protein BD626DRAFT_481470 [Auriculariopsis ampla]